jgi:hypothetical protein
MTLPGEARHLLSPTGNPEVLEGKPSYRLRGDLDFDGDEGLTRWLATRAAQRIDVELPAVGLPVGS